MRGPCCVDYVVAVEGLRVVPVADFSEIEARIEEVGISHCSLITFVSGVNWLWVTFPLLW